MNRPSFKAGDKGYVNRLASAPDFSLKSHSDDAGISFKTVSTIDDNSTLWDSKQYDTTSSRRKINSPTPRTSSDQDISVGKDDIKLL